MAVCSLGPEMWGVELIGCPPTLNSILKSDFAICCCIKSVNSTKFRQHMGASRTVRYIYAMEYYSAIKRNETELFVVRWMDLETVI